MPELGTEFQLLVFLSNDVERKFQISTKKRVNLIERASSDTKSFEVLRDTIGQRPTEKIAVGASDEAKNELAELLEQRKNNACK